jgi:Secretion system C-terminal sorting domain
MKKSLALMLFVFSLQTITAQIWCPAGAHWTYNVSSLGFPGYVDVVYSGDTVVNSITCKKLRKTFIGQNFSSAFIQNPMGTEITYEQNGVVFIKDNSVFDTLYNFKALIGDKWNMVRKSNMCDSTSSITVLDTGTIVIHSVPLKFLAVKLHFSAGNGIDHNDTIIEKIGFTSSYFIATDLCNAMLDAGEGGPFRCYNDNNFSTYKPHYSGACDFITGINEINAAALMTIYPNPTKNNLTINTRERNLSYVLYSMDGRSLKEGKVTANEIKCEELLSGMYLLAVKGEDGFLHYFKFTKE